LSWGHAVVVLWELRKTTPVTCVATVLLFVRWHVSFFNLRLTPVLVSCIHGPLILAAQLGPAGSTFAHCFPSAVRNYRAFTTLDTVAVQPRVLTGAAQWTAPRDSPNTLFMLAVPLHLPLLVYALITREPPLFFSPPVSPLSQISHFICLCIRNAEWQRLLTASGSPAFSPRVYLNPANTERR